MPISVMLVPLIELVCTDGADLYVFNRGIDSAKDVVDKVQQLLHAWNEVLKVTGGDIKYLKSVIGRYMTFNGEVENSLQS